MSQSLIPPEYVSQVLEQSESSHPTAPWNERYTMQLFSLGGARSLDTERIALVGSEGYNNYVAGNREITTDSHDAVCEKVRTIRIQQFTPPEEEPGGSEESGHSEESDESVESEESEAPEELEESEESSGGVLAESPPDSTSPVKPGPPAISGGSPALREPEAPPDPHAGVRWGHDRLSVHGDAEIRFGSRVYMAKGTFDRTWNGGVVRLASFEGVIVGGVFTRAICGPSAALSGFMTSDVYGGALKLSILRLFLAGLHYRAAKRTRWDTIYYGRRAPFTIVPALSVVKAPKRSGITGKIGRLAGAASKAFKVVRWFVAPISILHGGLQLLLLPVLFIARVLRRYLGKQPEVTLQQRTWIRSGTRVEAASLATVT